jgi:predicted PurR-regulated permease PerM
MAASDQPDRSDRSENRAALIVFLMVLAALLLVGFRMVEPYVLALLSGMVLAILARSPHRRLVAAGMGPRAAAAVVTGAVVLLVVGPLAIFATLAVRQAIAVATWVSHSETFSAAAILAKVASWGPVAMVVDDPAELQASLVNLLQEGSKHLSTSMLGLAKSLPETILHLVLGCLTCFFLLVDGRSFFLWIAGKIPMDADVRMRMAAAFKGTAISVVWASMVAAGVQALLALAVFLALSIPAASLALTATFILAWIPLVGATPVWLSGAAFLIATGAMGKLVALVILAAIAGVVDHLIRPWVLRGRGEMHPLVSLVAIFGGLHLFGLTGVFFGPILAAVLISVLQVWPLVGRRNGLHFGGDPGGGDFPLT